MVKYNWNYEVFMSLAQEQFFTLVVIGGVNLLLICVLIWIVRSNKTE